MSLSSISIMLLNLILVSTREAEPQKTDEVFWQEYTSEIVAMWCHWFSTSYVFKERRYWKEKYGGRKKNTTAYAMNMWLSGIDSNARIK